MAWLWKELVRAILTGVATWLIGAAAFLLPPIVIWTRKGVSFFTSDHQLAGWILSLGFSIFLVSLFVIFRQIVDTFQQRSIQVRTYPYLQALRALKDNIPNWDGIPEKYVYEFHSILDNLESEGFNLTFFRVPETEISQSCRDCDRNFLMMKIDGVLNVFQSIAKSKSRKMI